MIGVSPKALCISQNDSLARYGLRVSACASPVAYTVVGTGASGFATAYATSTVVSFATGRSRYRSRKQIASSHLLGLKLVQTLPLDGKKKKINSGRIF